MRDTIYRDDAIEAMEARIKWFNGDAIEDRCKRDAFIQALDALSALPSAEAVKVAYICDGRKCDSDCSECFRTTDIEHAKDFKLMGDTYFQQPSAEAEPTVIRSRTLMPTKDFKEWAKRIREVNPNAVVIPCDAEVVSAEAEWIPCSERLPKENEYVGNVCKYYLIQDEYGDMHVAHLSSRGWETIESIKALGCDVIAWMPLPKPYKGGEDE